MSVQSDDAAAVKRAKVILRTKVGSTLALSVAGLLWAASLPAGVSITLGFATVLSLWSIYEAARMKIFGGTPAALGAVVAVAFGAWNIHATFIARDGDAWASAALGQTPASQLALIFVFSGVAAVIGRSLVGVSRGTLHWRLGEQPQFAALVFLVALPLLALVPIRIAGGAGGLAIYLVLAKIGDIAGYYVGSTIGKRHPFPKLSPGKTVAGCVASLLVGIGAGAGFVLSGALEGARFGVMSGVLLGLVVNVTAQAGDLLESGFKRRAQVKDSGTTFGPSGGMLDLVDSLLLSAPLAAFLWPLLFELPS